ncbi:MAG: hypothetical protein IKU41_03325 [Clostridia bacterium]|nr:hypothetical protein [Clostridia bacterium]
MLGIIFIVVAVACAFTFPSFLIDAIKEDDPEIAKTARKMACATFGVLMLIIGTLMILLNW